MNLVQSAGVVCLTISIIGAIRMEFVRLAGANADALYAWEEWYLVMLFCGAFFLGLGAMRGGKK